MTSIPFPPCPWHVTDQALSDWREHLLPAAEDARLAAHVPTCAGCRARLTGSERAERALRNQRIPDLQVGIWRGMQTQLAQSHHRRLIPMKRVSIVGAVTAVVLVALFVVFLRTNRTPATSGTPTVIVAPTNTGHSTPTTIPLLTPAQAWGTAGQKILTLDARRYTIEDVMPNGRGIVAIDNSGPTTHAPRPQPRVVLIDPVTGAVQTIFTTTSWDIARAATDGRYIAWEGGFNLTGGPGSSNITVGYFDTQTGQTRLLANGTDDTLDSTAIFVSHGWLLLASNDNKFGLYEANLATGTTYTQLAPRLSLTISWPYVLTINHNYTGTGKPSPSDIAPAALFDLETSVQRDVTQLLAASYYDFNRFTLDGATIFTTVPLPGNTALQFEQIDQATQPSPQMRLLFTLPIANGSKDAAYFILADSRLILIQLPGVTGQVAAWDRTQNKLVTLPTPPNFTTTPVSLSNGTLWYWQQNGATTQLVLRDEAQLPK